jgi:hypothetical protein
VAHALVRAASALLPTPVIARRGCVEKSLDTARTTACATAASVTRPPEILAILFSVDYEQIGGRFAGGMGIV